MENCSRPLLLLLGCLASVSSFNGCVGVLGSQHVTAGRLIISGTPASAAQAGAFYAFRPSVSTSSASVTFAVENLPAWANFESGTGVLTGTPNFNDAGTYAGILISVTDGLASANLPRFSIEVVRSTVVSVSGPPIVLYTDLISGPTSGGENNKGAYVSIFGKNFGGTGAGSSVRVYIGSAEIDNYRYLGASKGRTDIQQITVQLGALGKQAPGKPLPVKVTVNGVSSNTDQTFMINPGRILFVNNVTGDDANAVIGDIAHPYRRVQGTNNVEQGAWGQARPGDIIVMRGTGTPWTDLGIENYFMRYRNKSGSAPTGAPGTGAIVLMGYPTEDAYIRGTLAGDMSGGCISAINGHTYPGLGQWAVITNLRIDCEGYDGPISEEIAGNHWRVVNNDLSASTAPTTGPRVPRMAGITGNGFNSVWLGNHIHDIQGSNEECHGIYIDGDGSYEIAYNHIEHIRSGNGFQIYASGGNGSTVANNVNLHHNIIHDVSKHGINLADGTSAGVTVYNNVVYNTSRAGIRFNTLNLSGAKIYNNTFYAINTSGNTYNGLIMNDWTLPSRSATIENNIFWPAANIPYQGGSTDLVALSGTTSHNLFYGGAGRPLGTAVISGDPMFVDAAANDFHLTSSSPAIGAGVAAVGALVTTDFGMTRRDRASIDIGAYTH
jgi:Putative Ig domain